MEQEKQDREKLLTRIRKLYAMSRESESSPHEAEIAMRRCQSLMAKFGVTEADLETSAFGSTTIGRNFRAVPTYVKVLGSAVALLHDCLCVRGDTIEFRGFSIDAEVAALTYQYLLSGMERSLRLRKVDGSVAPGRSASFDYRVGFALAVSERCRAIDQERKAREQEAAAQVPSAGSSLVVRKLAIVREECGKGLVSGKRRSVRYRDGAAHSAGASDGKAVSLAEQLSARRNKALS
ncbi:MAG: DUF2786 domain-containing protein [Granulosicoccus sp.]